MNINTRSPFMNPINQPDDPGPGVCPSCGCRCRKSEDAVTPNTRKVIAKNLKRGMNPLTLARDMGWTLGRLKRVTETQSIPSRHPYEKEPEPAGT